MALYALSDLHIANDVNRQALLDLPGHGADDWLILAGDVCERLEHLAFAFDVLGRRFGRLIWVPGNHELWTETRDGVPLRGVAKYEALVSLARDFGVLTPEDPFALWQGPDGPCVLVPLFLLYDYSFRPDGIAEQDAVAWARASRVRCSDEVLLSPAPYAGRADWCRDRIALTRRRLETELPPGLPTVLINHFPLRQDLATLPRIPRFSIWCGTRATQDWPQRYRALACVHGHLHLPRTHWRDGVRFEEVSLGYPREWPAEGGMAARLRRVLDGSPHSSASRTAGRAIAASA
jgi:predicted phosphodiesterase